MSKKPMGDIPLLIVIVVFLAVVGVVSFWLRDGARL
jgi:hypothetical protein